MNEDMYLSAGAGVGTAMGEIDLNAVLRDCE